MVIRDKATIFVVVKSYIIAYIRYPYESLKHRKIAKSCPEHITLMLRCQVVKLFLLKDVTLTTTVTTVTITTITI